MEDLWALRKERDHGRLIRKHPQEYGPVHSGEDAHIGPRGVNIEEFGIAAPFSDHKKRVKSSTCYRAHPRLSENDKWYEESLQDHDGARLRLLHLHPGNAEDPIEGTLVCVSLKDAPRYDCVSYSWGDHEYWKKIKIDDKPGFAVTLTLWHALRRLRSSCAVRPLWIDAICINQFNTAERNSQVLHMGTTFSSARSVIVWLGECEVEKGDSRVIQGPMDTQAFLHRLQSTNEDQTKAWWNRLWVIQEVAMAEELMVYLGPYILSWTEFIDIAKRRQECAPIMNLSEIRTNVRHLGTDSKPVRLFDILLNTGNCYASDPLDYVFGLAGLAAGLASGPCERDVLERYRLLPNYSFTSNHLLLQLSNYVTDKVLLEGHRKTISFNASLSDEQFKLVTLLKWLAQVGHTQLFRLLAESRLIHPDSIDEQPLLLAARHDRVPIVRYILETFRIDPNTTDHNGNSTLHFAASGGSMNVVEYLLENNSVNVNLRDHAEQRTALSRAIGCGHQQVVQILLDSGKVQDAAAQLPEEGLLDFLRLKRFDGIANLLLDHRIATQAMAGQMPTPGSSFTFWYFARSL